MFNFARIVLGAIGRRIIGNSLLKTLDRIERETANLSNGAPHHKLKILYGPSFCIYDPCFAYDRLFSDALRLRGAAIIPIYCDGIQSVECNYFGGSWLAGSFQEACRDCVKRSKTLWKANSRTAIPLSKYVGPQDRRLVAAVVDLLAPGTWSTYEENRLPLGQWAKDILVNNYMVANPLLISGHEELGKVHLKNLLLLKVAYERLIEDVKPNRVVANDSYYGMWALLGNLAQRSNIPFYSYWPIGGGRVAMAMNSPSMNLDFRSSWPNFASKPISAEMSSRVDEWLGPSSCTRIALIETHRPGAHQHSSFNTSALDPSKPTALLAANVVWDLAALNKQVVFEDMMTWISATIEWFRTHQQYQLIIKPHPVEVNPKIPVTRERVHVALENSGCVIPANVFLLEPEDSITVYELSRHVKVVLVHTTTVGFEMAAIGLPVITTGRAPYRGFGFTFDAGSQSEYFTLIDDALSDRLLYDRATFSALAKKFTALYHFHYFMDLGIVHVGDGTTIKIRTAKDLLPGHNKMLDYILDSIINGEPIISDDRIPPAS